MKIMKMIKSKSSIQNTKMGSGKNKIKYSLLKKYLKLQIEIQKTFIYIKFLLLKYNSKKKKMKSIIFLISILLKKRRR